MMLLTKSPATIFKRIVAVILTDQLVFSGGARARRGHGRGDDDHARRVRGRGARRGRDRGARRGRDRGVRRGRDRDGRTFGF